MLILQIHKVSYNAKVKQTWLVMLVGYECIPLKLSCTKKHYVQTLCALDPSRHTGLCVCARDRKSETHTAVDLHSSILLICMGQTHWVLLCPPFEPNVIQMTGGFPQAEVGGPEVFMGQR